MIILEQRDDQASYSVIAGTDIDTDASSATYKY
jgi:hypothetical protein